MLKKIFKKIFTEPQNGSVKKNYSGKNQKFSGNQQSFNNKKSFSSSDDRNGNRSENGNFKPRSNFRSDDRNGNRSENGNFKPRSNFRSDDRNGNRSENGGFKPRSNFRSDDRNGNRNENGNFKPRSNFRSDDRNGNRSENGGFKPRSNFRSDDRNGNRNENGNFKPRSNFRSDDRNGNRSESGGFKPRSNFRSDDRNGNRSESGGFKPRSNFRSDDRNGNRSESGGFKPRSNFRSGDRNGNRSESGGFKPRSNFRSDDRNGNRSESGGFKPRSNFRSDDRNGNRSESGGFKPRSNFRSDDRNGNRSESGGFKQKWEATYEDGKIASELVLEETKLQNKEIHEEKHFDIKKNLDQYEKKIDGESEEIVDNDEDKKQFDGDENIEEPKEDAPVNEKENFANLGITDSGLLDILTAQKITKAMPVQQQIIPLAMGNKSILCSSPTGSGKTLTFALPILQKYKEKKIYQVLILSPTREIAMQSKKVFENLLGKEAKRKIGLIIGGVDMLEQKRVLRNYPPILIATPGRLIDMVNQGFIWLNYTNILVIDEIDRMFDLGFEEDIDYIFQELTKKKPNKNAHTDAMLNKSIEDLQIWMFTATLLPSIERMVNKYVPNYEMVLIDKKMKINENIDHCMILVRNDARFDALSQIIRKFEKEKIIVFFNTINETLNHVTKMRNAGFNNCIALHSKKRQNERERSLNQFRQGKKNILLATNVASRGIDVPKISVVVNYSIPFNSEEYIHRIGRTGRANESGKAITFIQRANQKDFMKLKRDIKFNFQIQNLEEFFENT